MFSQILKALRARRIAEELLTELDQMLSHTAWMFDRASSVLQRTVTADEVRESLYRRDREVNELERSMRRKIIRHLTINPDSEIAGCLMFMSLAKDAERIGDYCKNVFEVGVFYRRQLRVEHYAGPLNEVRQQVQTMFEQARKAIGQASEDTAKSVIDSAGQIGKKCEGVIRQLLQEHHKLDTDEAVAYSLLARHYKRVSAHLSNICTAVVSPIDMLDFHDEPAPLDSAPPPDQP
jgi:phosphate transport system protein